MKNFRTKITLGSLVILTLFSCKKGETTEMDDENADAKMVSVAKNDSISTTASQEIPGKKFVKNAEVDMEVKDVYDATIFIEKKLRDLGGFVTESRLNTIVISAETYETSEKDATLVKKFSMENQMQVRVPTEQLSDFLTVVNDKNLFLNSRIITAEDVTDNAKIAEMEMQKLAKTSKVIDQMKNTGEKVEKTKENAEEENSQKIENLKLADNLKYSTINLSIKEPKIRIAEIAVTNTNSIDARYKFSFLYDLKSASANGFYLVEKVFVGLVAIWPFVLAGISGFLFYRKRRRISKNIPQD